MTAKVTLTHFLRAAAEIGQAGENDTLPYDVDAKFIKEKGAELSDLCFRFFQAVERKPEREVASFMNGITVPSERLLAPTGSHGFRITTKIHPFWNLYLNGLGLAIAEANEVRRSARVHSYRLPGQGNSFFDRSRSWRSYKEATLKDAAINADGAVIVQTDISSFYEHIYHHRLENSIDDIFDGVSTVSTQIDRLLSKLASGRSFGLPVGGQCARVLAEVMMSPIDESLSDAGLAWHRYVDDITIVCGSQQAAYGALSTLSHALADFGLSLNRTKTTILSAKHYADYVEAQIGDVDETSAALRELDLHFDPYSDAAQAEYEDLKKSLDDIDIEFLLGLERAKSQPDTFVMAQISRALKFQDPKTASQICATLLDPRNLDAFRASWSKIMRGVYSVRADENFAVVYDEIDILLDRLRRRRRTCLRRKLTFCTFSELFDSQKPMCEASSSATSIKPAPLSPFAVHAWTAGGIGGDRASFQRLRNQWRDLSSDEQRMLWLAAPDFGEEGIYAQAVGENVASGLEPRDRERSRQDICFDLRGLGQ